MPRAQHPQSRDEHLVFVKNVPAYMGTASIPELFAQYRPLRVKNVYPNGHITTVVVSFRTYEEAAQAQQDTDGMRLESVVLRVEMYSKHRSLRFLREGRVTRRPFGAVQEHAEDAAEDYTVYQPEEEYTPPLEQTPQGIPGAATWAQIVRHDRRPGMTPLPAPPVVAYQQGSINGHEEVAHEEDNAAASPHSSHVSELGDAHSNHVETGKMRLHSPESITTESTRGETHLEDDCNLGGLSAMTKGQLTASSSIFAASEPVNTDQRIRQRHCQHCALCQFAMRLRG
jgi:hypothetical protein